MPMSLGTNSLVMNIIQVCKIDQYTVWPAYCGFSISKCVHPFYPIAITLSFSILSVV